MTRGPRIVIIGAGIAGIGTAIKLREAGLGTGTPAVRLHVTSMSATSSVMALPDGRLWRVDQSGCREAVGQPLDRAVRLKGGRLVTDGDVIST